MNKDNFEVKYEYVPSKQSEIKLQKAFEIIFEKIIKPEEYNQTDLVSEISKNTITDAN